MNLDFNRGSFPLPFTEMALTFRSAFITFNVGCIQFSIFSCDNATDERTCTSFTVVTWGEDENQPGVKGWCAGFSSSPLTIR